MTGLCFAAVGWALAETPPRLSLRSAAVAAATLAVGGAVLDGRAAAMCAQTSAVLTLWIFAVATPRRIAASTERLGRQTMQIYLLHAPYIIKIACVATALLPPAAGLPVAVSLAIGGALAAAFVLGRLGLGWLWAEPRRAAPTQPATIAAIKFI